MHGLEALDRDILAIPEPEPHDVQHVGRAAAALAANLVSVRASGRTAAGGCCATTAALLALRRAFGTHIAGGPPVQLKGCEHLVVARFQ